MASGRKKGKLAAYAMKRVTAGAHLPTPWLFEPAKGPDDYGKKIFTPSEKNRFEQMPSKIFMEKVIIFACIYFVSNRSVSI